MTKENIKEIGRAVSQWRGRKKKSLNWLAKETGLDRHTLSDIERGLKTRILNSTKVALEDKLGMQF